MPPLIYTVAGSEKDLLGIMELQRNNLATSLTPEEIATQGFVTVIHSLADLKKMNDIEHHVICKDGDKVVAYLLAMTARSKEDIPVLVPMFETFAKLSYKVKIVSSYRYIVVGQVCVDKNYRGQGVLDKCYDTYKKCFDNKYDFAITEIARRNSRSMNAHKRIGFAEIHTYLSPVTEEWSIVIWDW